MTDLALPPDLAPAPYSFEQDWQLASRIARTEFVPPALRGKPEAVLACILTGREIGIGPMQSLRQVFVNNGRIGFMAQLMVDLVRSRGHRFRTIERTAERATVEGVRKDDPGHAERVTFTIEDAKRAKLTGKDTYQQYPADMCWSRATSALCRTMFPDVLHGGAYTPEELGDDRPPATTAVQAGPVEVNGHPIDGEPFADGVPKRWAIENVRDDQDAKWLLRQPEVSDDYREAVKAVIAAAGLHWPAFWKTGNATEWSNALRLALEQMTEQSDPGLQGHPSATDHPDASPGSGHQSGGSATRTDEAPGQPGRPSGLPPDSTLTSPSTPEQEASPTEADRSGAEGANHQGKPERDAGLGPSAASTPPGAFPPAPGGSNRPAGGTTAPTSVRGRQTKTRDTAGRAPTSDEEEQALFEQQQADNPGRHTR